jgi:hypothetical protein
VRYEILITVTMKNTVFYDGAILVSKIVTNVSGKPTASIFMIKEYGEYGKK